MRRGCIGMVLAVWLASSGFVSGAGQLYSKAVRFAKAGQEDFAFMQYNNLLRNYPSSRYREQALFATGEYYYQVLNYKEAANAFDALLTEYPKSKQRLYALAYLLSIANDQQDDLSAKDLEKQIIELQQVSFVFRETKEVVFKSPLYQDYKVIIHIDKIEFFVEGELFAKVAY